MQLNMDSDCFEVDTCLIAIHIQRNNKASPLVIKSTQLRYNHSLMKITLACSASNAIQLPLFWNDWTISSDELHMDLF